ncbi:MAG: hypothetical protein WD396_10345 [Pseudohongiellaceae bacterium]
MLVFGSKPETLPVAIKRDATTGLPLLSEQDAVVQSILAYLALPYSVTEYGCGKKASLIIDQLLALEIPPYAIARVLVLERNMSPAALAQGDAERREHALVADNLLWNLADTSDPHLREMLATLLPEIELADDGGIHAGPYVLRSIPRVQFESTRSHLSTQLTFWDERNARPVQRLIDPSLAREQTFTLPDLRKLLRAPEALVFRAPLLGHFRLAIEALTDRQRAELGGEVPGKERGEELSEELSEELAEAEGLATISVAEEAAVVRRLTGAEPGSIGDPQTWTYANTLRPADDAAATDLDHYRQQQLLTGSGDAYAAARDRLFRARQRRGDDISAILAELRQVDQDCDVFRRCGTDARWSVERLQPLADAATVFVYFDALQALAGRLRGGQEIHTFLENHGVLQELRGLGVRLRRRLDWLAEASLSEDGRIDGRALGPGFVAATIETIRQMNRAGLTVFMDKVGNVHGLLVNRQTAADLDAGKRSPAELCRRSIWHGSHIDTVNDAGKFDGRLGVLGGIETLNILSDLARHCELPVAGGDNGCVTHVSAFIGEEMTFTGAGVSMPGSAAVCSRAEVSAIQEMVNGAGERFGDLLEDMVEAVGDEQRRGGIDLVNDLAGAPAGQRTQNCSEPAAFYSPHSFERHIEQGPVLDRAGVPIAMVGTIMGIHQEDFFCDGEQAEAAALEMNRRLRELTLEPAFIEVRITVGMLEGLGEPAVHESVSPAWRWTLTGELNHAGATPTADRRDPGVAAGRLAREFRNWVGQHLPADLRDDMKPLVGNVNMLPGSNRNVIPESISLTIALASRTGAARAAVDALLTEDLGKTLESFAVGTLSRQIAGGGEGIRLSRIEPIGFINLFPRARLTIDLRADQQETMDSFRQRIDDVIADTEKEYGVRIAAEIQQQVAPSDLRRSGQSLLMERSYGGSHNPRETELLSDIVRGTLLQLAVTRAALTREASVDFNLFEFVESHLPQAWRQKIPVFTSGALHDTCNIASRAQQLRGYTAT